MNETSRVAFLDCVAMFLGMWEIREQKLLQNIVKHLRKRSMRAIESKGNYDFTSMHRFSFIVEDINLYN